MYKIQNPKLDGSEIVAKLTFPSYGIQVILIHKMTFQSSLYCYSCLPKSSQQSLDGDFLIIEFFFNPDF